MHEAWNHGDGPRLVLIADMWHPELTPNMREPFVKAASNELGLLSGKLIPDGNDSDESMHPTKSDIITDMDDHVYQQHKKYFQSEAPELGKWFTEDSKQP